MGDLSRQWWAAAREWIREGRVRHAGPGIGLALGGGFARGIAHVGVLRVLEEQKVPVDYVAGVSAGAIVAAAWASGADSYEIEKVARTMTFKDVARWKLSHLGLAGSERMIAFLGRLLKCTRFEEMKTRLAVVATDIVKGEPVVFHGSGDVIAAVRASCCYPGLFLPMEIDRRLLVDGGITMEIPAKALRDIGARHVISVGLPMQHMTMNPQHMLSVVTRCFQILMRRAEHEWRRYSNVVITPDVASLGWDSYAEADRMIAAGRRAAEAVMPRIEHWLRRAHDA